MVHFAGCSCAQRRCLKNTQYTRYSVKCNYSPPESPIIGYNNAAIISVSPHSHNDLESSFHHSEENVVAFLFTREAFWFQTPSVLLSF